MLFSYSEVLQKEAGCKESWSRLVAEALVKHAQAKETRGPTSEHRLLLPLVSEVSPVQRETGLEAGRQGGVMEKNDVGCEFVIQIQGLQSNRYPKTDV